MIHVNKNVKYNEIQSWKPIGTDIRLQRASMACVRAFGHIRKLVCTIRTLPFGMHALNYSRKLSKIKGPYLNFPYYITHIHTLKLGKFNLQCLRVLECRAEKIYLLTNRKTFFQTLIIIKCNL